MLGGHETVRKGGEEKRGKEDRKKGECKKRSNGGHIESNGKE